MKVAFNSVCTKNYSTSFKSNKQMFFTRDELVFAIDEDIDRQKKIRKQNANQVDPRTPRNILFDVFAPNSQDTLKRKIHRNMALIGLDAHAQYEVEHYTNHKLSAASKDAFYKAMDYSPKSGSVDDKIRYYQRMCELEAKVDLVQDKNVLKQINKFFKQFKKEQIVATRLPDIEVLMDMVDKSIGYEE